MNVMMWLVGAQGVAIVVLSVLLARALRAWRRLAAMPAMRVDMEVPEDEQVLRSVARHYRALWGDEVFFLVAAEIKATGGPDFAALSACAESLGDGEAASSGPHGSAEGVAAS